MVRGQDGRRADEAGAVPFTSAEGGRGREAAHPGHFQAAHSPPARLTDDKFHPLLLFFRRRHRALFQLNLHLTTKKKAITRVPTNQVGTFDASVWMFAPPSPLQ